ncbi:MAG: ABC transporter permease subunit [Solirubrobacteraceae bacterium]|nr:ABC transporter permease subunit [Solirubrobacteraceae bacterium]
MSTRIPTRRAAGPAASRTGRLLSWLAPLLTVGGLIALWQGYVRWHEVDPIVLPAPTDVANALWRDRELLLTATEHTLLVLLLGLVAALALGTLCGIALHRSPALRRALEPLLVGSQAVPIPILAPLLVVWLGFGLTPQLVLVVVVAFFPVAVATRDALAGLSPETALVLRNLGATPAQRLRLVELPGALPGILTGVRLAVVFAVIGAVFADATGQSATTAADPTSSGGLGRIVADAVPQLQTDRAFAAIVLLVALSLALFWSLGGVERRLDRRSSPSLPI